MRYTLLMRCAIAWLAMTAVVVPAREVRAADVLLVTGPDLRAPLSRALGDAGLTPAPEAPPEAPARTGALVDEAARAYAAMDVARALALLAEAGMELDRVGGGEDGPGVAARVALLEAMALHSVGREGEVGDAIRRTLVVAPDLRIDPVEYPPWLLERAIALAEVPLPKATLELRGAPGAEARVDGAVACVLPCARELPVGSHRVRVARTGRRPFTTTVALSGPTTVEVALRPDVAALAGEARAAMTAGLPPEEALTAFDAVVWANLREREGRSPVLEGALHRVEAPRRNASVPLEARDPASVERACRALVSALTAEAVAARPRGRAPRPRPAPTRWYERPWVWIATGAVLVAGGIGIAVAATPRPDGFTPALEVP